MSKLHFYKCAHFLLFLSLSTFFIHHFHSYTKTHTLIPLIPTPNSHISTLIPRNFTPIPHFPTLIPDILTYVPRIPHIPSFHPDFQYSLLDSWHSHHSHPDSPYSHSDSLYSRHSAHSFPRFPIPAFTHSHIYQCQKKIDDWNWCRHVTDFFQYIHAWNQGGIIISIYDISLLQFLTCKNTINLKECVAEIAFL